MSLRVKVRVIRGQLDIGLINWNPLNLIPSSVCGLRKVIIYPHLKWIHNLKDDLKWDLRNNSRHVGGVSADVWGEAEYFLVPGTNQISHWPRTIPIPDPECKPEKVDRSLVIGHSASSPLSGWFKVYTRPYILPWARPSIVHPLSRTYNHPCNFDSKSEKIRSTWIVSAFKLQVSKWTIYKYHWQNSWLLGSCQSQKGLSILDCITTGSFIITDWN